MAFLMLLLACDTSPVQTTGKVSSFDVRCGDDLWTAMGHVDQRTALNVSMCWHTLDGDEMCDMTPAPETIIYRPVAGFVADCTEYGADAWLRVSYLLTSDQTF